MVAEALSLAVEPRAPGHPRRDRAAGYVPAVMYGHGIAPRALRVESRELLALLARGGAHHLVQLAVGGDPERPTVVIKEVQHHPVTRAVVHVDFQAVSAQERIHADVPLHVVGEDQVAKAGGVLQVLLHAVRVSCLPADLPERIDVPVAGLATGQTLTVSALRVPDGVLVLNDGGEVVAHALAPRTAAAEEGRPATPGATAE